MSESESPPHTRLLQELDRVHRESIFPVLFEHLSFDMVASFECGIARQNGVVLLKSTTFWMSHDRDPGGQMKFVYDDEFGRRAGSMLSSDNLTAVCKPGDFDVAIVGLPSLLFRKSTPTRRLLTRSLGAWKARWRRQRVCAALSPIRQVDWHAEGLEWRLHEPRADLRRQRLLLHGQGRHRHGSGGDRHASVRPSRSLRPPHVLREQFGRHSHRHVNL